MEILNVKIIFPVRLISLREVGVHVQYISGGIHAMLYTSTTLGPALPLRLSNSSDRSKWLKMVHLR